MIRKHTIRFICAVILTALLLSACGGSGSKTADAGSNSPADSKAEERKVEEGAVEESAETADHEVDAAENTEDGPEVTDETLPSEEALLYDTGEKAAGDDSTGGLEPVGFEEFYDSISPNMFLMYKYGDDAFDSENIIINNGFEITVGMFSGSYEYEENEDGLLTIKAAVTLKGNTVEQSFYFGKMDGKYVMIPVGDYFMKTYEPDNPVWDEPVFIEN